MLFRKGGTASAILAVALLVAILASMNSMVNHINSQAEALEGLVGVGGTHLVLNRDSSSLADSRIDAQLADRLRNDDSIKTVMPQRILAATLVTGSDTRTVSVRGVEDVSVFLKLRGAQVSGTAARLETEANVGEVLAQVISVKIGDRVRIGVGNNVLEVRIVGIVRTLAQSDSELLVPMGLANRLAGGSGEVSLIEFTIKDNADREETINRITDLLPKDVKVVQVQRLKEFVRGMNQQTITFLSLWSLTVYAVVAAASYVVATRLIAESSYELVMLRALGAKKRRLFTLVLTYTVVTALLGSILGIALGTAGTQTASTILRWIQPGVEITPFLEAEQALQTLLLTLASSILGCVYPALKPARTRYREQL